MKRALCGLALALVAGCGAQHHTADKASASPSGQVGGRGVIGSLTISAAYVPEPASPDVAAAYLTVHNSGKVADTLLRAGTPAGETTTLHRDVISGRSESMVALPSLTIPAGKTVVMKPGGAHLMIEHPRKDLVEGGQLELTLVFAHAGRLTMQVPVISTTGMMPGMQMP